MQRRRRGTEDINGDHPSIGLGDRLGCHLAPPARRRPQIKHHARAAKNLVFFLDLEELKGSATAELLSASRLHPVITSLSHIPLPSKVNASSEQHRCSKTYAEEKPLLNPLGSPILIQSEETSTLLKLI